jgi:UDP-N-acetylenolpyruvoylglucosamine reductase
MNILSIRNKKIITENTLGSVFKNVIKDSKKIYIWELIDKLDLRGKTIHNITINNTNPNIFVNSNNANAKDLNSLIKYISDTLFKNYNIQIEREIECVE